jgi:AraC-like DNA-binding protein
MKPDITKNKPISLPVHGIIAQSRLQRPEFNIAPHLHDKPVLIYTASGQGRCLLRDSQIKLKTNTAILVNNNVAHQLLDEPRKPMTVFSIYFDPAATGINSTIRESLLNNVTPLDLPIYHSRQIRQTIRQILYEQKNHPPAFDISISQSLTQILLQLYRYALSTKSPASRDSSKSRTRVAEVLDFIAENYYESQPLSESAKMAKLSQRQFSTICKSIKGASYVQYINTLRTNKAKDLLDNTDMPVAAIAFEVGFEDLSTFYRAFKKHHKTSPMSFRKALTTIAPEI